MPSAPRKKSEETSSLGRQQKPVEIARGPQGKRTFSRCRTPKHLAHGPFDPGRPRRRGGGRYVQGGRGQGASTTPRRHVPLRGERRPWRREKPAGKINLYCVLSDELEKPRKPKRGLRECPLGRKNKADFGQKWFEVRLGGCRGMGRAPRPGRRHERKRRGSSCSLTHFVWDLKRSSSWRVERVDAGNRNGAYVMSGSSGSNNRDSFVVLN